MPKIIMTKGLPGSGKSHWAKDVVKNDSTWKRINKDELRAMIDDGKWTAENEKIVLQVRNELMNLFMDKELNIIVDDTNFDEKHETYLRYVIEDFNRAFEGAAHYDFEIKEFNTAVGTCLERDAARSKPVGEKVILGMYNRYVAKPFVARKQDTKLPHCIVVDIDGTVATNPDRSPYDSTKLHEDKPIPSVIELINRYVADPHSGIKQDTTIIFLTGRDEKTRKVTEDWLDEEFGDYELFMRPEGEKRSDFIIKKEILEKDILPHYQVDFVLEDRTRNVKMMRDDLGLKVLQVAEGNF